MYPNQLSRERPAAQPQTESQDSPVINEDNDDQAEPTSPADEDQTEPASPAHEQPEPSSPQPVVEEQAEPIVQNGPASSPQAQPAAEWACPFCTMPNPADLEFCHMCDPQGWGIGGRRPPRSG